MAHGFLPRNFIPLATLAELANKPTALAPIAERCPNDAVASAQHASLHREHNIQRKIKDMRQKTISKINGRH